MGRQVSVAAAQGQGRARRPPGSASAQPRTDLTVYSLAMLSRCEKIWWMARGITPAASQRRHGHSSVQGCGERKQRGSRSGGGAPAPSVRLSEMSPVMVCVCRSRRWGVGCGERHRHPCTSTRAVADPAAAAAAAITAPHLARAGLAVCEDGAVEALKHLLHDGRHRRAVQPLLRGVSAKHLRRRRRRGEGWRRRGRSSCGGWLAPACFGLPVCPALSCPPAPPLTINK